LSLEFFIIVAASLFSTILTSFMGASVDRKMTGGSITSPPRSYCVCGEPLKGYQLIPIIYPLIVKFRAPCGNKIPYRYPMTELFTALGTALGVWMILNSGLYFGIAIIALSFFISAMMIVSPHQKK